MPASARHVRAIQVFYPRVYLACHVNHVRRASTEANITAHESTVLAHLALESPTRPTALAAHLGVSKSTLSATIKRLSALGYVARRADPDDRRSVGVQLTTAGARAMALSSVLDRKRVSALLAHLSAAERARAVDGLRLLARAAAALRQPRRSA